MKKQILLVAMLCLFTLLGCKENSEKPSDLSQITLVSPEEAALLLQMQNTQLVDVRTVEEFETGKIEGAVNLVYQKNFSEKIAELDKSKPVLVYCQSGGRSAKCAEILKEAGFEKIYDLEGGLTQWARAGNEILK
ncbi:MAG TPA: rhodanese-like domain-containing protein [Flavobacteriaceae bacterium]|nr:rhodanese-like domain-containing protein [Flavobacteriaceae bacterium]